MATKFKPVEVEQSEINDLVVVAAQNPVALFTDKEKYSEFYAKIKAQTDLHTPDTSTPKGREEIKSLAFKVTKAKTALDKAAMGLTEQWRTQTAAVNASRKVMVAELDGLAAAVRAPVTEWEEAEKVRVFECRGIINGFILSATVALDDDAASVKTRGVDVWNTQIDAAKFGDMFDEAVTEKDRAVATLKTAFARLTQEEADRAELAALRVAAAERERIEAENAALAAHARRAAEEEAAEQRRVDAAIAAEEARMRAAEEAAATAAANKARQEAAEAQAARDAAHDAEMAAARKAASDAKAASDELVAAEAARHAEAKRLADEQAKRDASVAHRRKIKTAVKVSLMAAGASEEVAVAIVNAIVAGTVPNVTLAF